MLIDHPGLQSAIGAKGTRRAQLWSDIAEHRKAKMLPVVHEWRVALAADGWSLEPTYTHEPLEQAWRAKRDGFVIGGLARPIPGEHGTVPKPDLCGWGPDGAAIELPESYDLEKIKAAMLKCSECKREGVETKRYAFANRCCAECGPKFMAALPPNWST